MLLAGADNDALKRILNDPHHPHFRPIIDFLKRSERTGVIDLVLACIDDPHAPSSVFSVIAKRHDLKIEFNDATDDNHRKTLDSNVRALLFRNVREMLTNVIKHSRAQNVRVQIISEGSCLKITVEDDGVGFNPDADSTKQKQAEGFGLFSIQERMADLGGSFDIQSHPGKGCRMTLISPPIVGKG